MNVDIGQNRAQHTPHASWGIVVTIHRKNGDGAITTRYCGTYDRTTEQIFVGDHGFQDKDRLVYNDSGMPYWQNDYKSLMGKLNRLTIPPSVGNYPNRIEYSDGPDNSESIISYEMWPIWPLNAKTALDFKNLGMSVDGHGQVDHVGAVMEVL